MSPTATPSAPDRRSFAKISFAQAIRLCRAGAPVAATFGFAWREEMLSQEAMEPLRRYVRIGDQNETWRYNRRRLYAPDQIFGLDGTGYEILHEYDFLYTKDCELIFVLALFGEEFAINMGGSETERYQEYLQENEGLSLLAP